MEHWIVTDKTSDETAELTANQVEELTGVEFSYIEWVIEQDGFFENGRWKITSPKRRTIIST